MTSKRFSQILIRNYCSSKRSNGEKPATSLPRNDASSILDDPSSFKVIFQFEFVWLQFAIPLIDLSQLPEEPTTCCMSGCDNCVWIQYAKELTDLYRDSGAQARKILKEKIKDPSIQMFLQLELKKLEQDSINNIDKKPK